MSALIYTRKLALEGLQQAGHSWCTVTMDRREREGTKARKDVPSFSIDDTQLGRVRIHSLGRESDEY